MVSERVRRLASLPDRLWIRVSKHKNFEKIVGWRFSIPLLVLLSFFALNIGTTGPAYLSDEIGYLDKAATVAGSTVHMSTDWFGGYSFMISPAFMISSDPFVAWKIIVGLNAIMWAGTAFLLQYVLRKTHPKASAQAIFLATGGAMLYPSWLSMTGYAFSTSGFVLVFMAALAALLKSDLKHLGWLTVAGVSAGYLGWIHPLGMIMAGLFVLLVTVLALIKRRLALFGAGLVSGSIAIMYSLAVHPWFTNAMGGNLLDDSHYSEGVANLSTAITTWHYWIQVGELFVGLVFFTLVATFGLALYGALPTVNKALRAPSRWRESLQDVNLIVMLLPILLIAGVIGVTIVTWGATEKLRIDQWIYGRYTDLYLLPLIGFGLLASWRLKSALLTAGAIITSGVMLTLVTSPENLWSDYVNKVNLQAFWPMHIASIVHMNTYWLWALLGAAGVVAVGLLGTQQRKIYLPILVLPLMLAGVGNYMFKQRITTDYSTVSSVYYDIKADYGRDDCIGFSLGPDSYERFNLYSYYLHGYDVRRMSVEQWQQENCSGPYLTYDATVANANGLELDQTEARSGLHMIVRDTTLAGTQ